MEIVIKNPYAIYVHCDAAMDYDSKNSGGVGVQIIFPEDINLPDICISIGTYEKANIERLELEAIHRGMLEIIKQFDERKDELIGVRNVIITTDRIKLSDQERTNHFRINEWRRNGWRNHENKAIKNSDLLDLIDKTRKKLIDQSHCSVSINYERRKRNRTADKLAKKGKRIPQIRKDIAKHGMKIGKREFTGDEIDYRVINPEEEIIIRVYKKEPIGEQWEISAEICFGPFLGKKINLYCDGNLEKLLHRSHKYKVKIYKRFTYHVTIYEDIHEVS